MNTAVFVMAHYWMHSFKTLVGAITMAQCRTKNGHLLATANRVLGIPAMGSPSYAVTQADMDALYNELDRISKNNEKFLTPEMDDEDFSEVFGLPPKVVTQEMRRERFMVACRTSNEAHDDLKNLCKVLGLYVGEGWSQV
jgi:hypothetical protein